MNTQPSVPAFITHANLKCKKYIHLYDEICVWFHLKVGNLFCSFYQADWWNLMKQSVTVGAQLLWSGRYGCNNGRYGCTIVMSYIEINKAVSQWLLTFNLCVSVTWPLTCAFHIPCTHTPEIIDMHRGMCDKFMIPTNTYSDSMQELVMALGQEYSCFRWKQAISRNDISIRNNISIILNGIEIEF